ncbi:MAG: response regulator [Archangium sp.]|nr:response regulator [Archangium sp.]MDP3155269.1 response regulator [Archangium sp.]
MKKIEPATIWTSPVLYVEDELPNWEVVELRLGNRCTLQWAKSSEEACDRVRSQKGEFLAILMDIQLSGSALDGIQLTRALRGKEAVDKLPDFARELPRVTCPIFFVTAYGNLYSGPQLTDAGADGWMPKPVDFLKLVTLLSRANVMRTLETLKSPRLEP